jgi:hypothetical protein
MGRGVRLGPRLYLRDDQVRLAEGKGGVPSVSYRTLRAGRSARIHAAAGQGPIDGAFTRWQLWNGRTNLCHS